MAEKKFHRVKMNVAISGEQDVNYQLGNEHGFAFDHGSVQVIHPDLAKAWAEAGHCTFIEEADAPEWKAPEAPKPAEAAKGGEPEQQTGDPTQDPKPEGGKKNSRKKAAKGGDQQ